MPTRIVTVSELKVKPGALMAEVEQQGVPVRHPGWQTKRCDCTL